MLQRQRGLLDVSKVPADGPSSVHDRIVTSVKEKNNKSNALNLTCHEIMQLKHSPLWWDHILSEFGYKIYSLFCMIMLHHRLFSSNGLWQKKKQTTLFWLVEERTIILRNIFRGSLPSMAYQHGQEKIIQQLGCKYIWSPSLEQLWREDWDRKTCLSGTGKLQIKWKEARSTASSHPVNCRIDRAESSF